MAKAVIQTWKDELKEYVTQPSCRSSLMTIRHLQPDSLTYCEYYGPRRSESFDKLVLHDLVLTTFSIVRQDWKRSQDPQTERKETLYAIKWNRIVLDEG